MTEQRYKVIYSKDGEPAKIFDEVKARLVFPDDCADLLNSQDDRIAELEAQLQVAQAECISDYKNIAVKAVEGAFNYLREAANNSIDNGFIQNGMAVHEILDEIGAQHLLCLESSTTGERKVKLELEIAELSSELRAPIEAWRKEKELTHENIASIMQEIADMYQRKLLTLALEKGQ